MCAKLGIGAIINPWVLYAIKTQLIQSISSLLSKCPNLYYLFILQCCYHHIFLIKTEGLINFEKSNQAMLSMWTANPKPKSFTIYFMAFKK